MISTGLRADPGTLDVTWPLEVSMPRRIRVFSLDYLRRFLIIHERSMWNLMAGMAYASPIGMFPAPDVLAGDAWHDIRLTEAECRIWDELCQEFRAEHPQ
ncbi:MAG TPA: hypothetical protein VGH27_36395 [Streptosporangiaceae bacterium]